MANWIDCKSACFELAYFSFVPNLLADTGLTQVFLPASAHVSYLQNRVFTTCGVFLRVSGKSSVGSFIWRRLGKLLNTKRKEVPVSGLPGTAQVLEKLTLTSFIQRAFHGAG